MEPDRREKLIELCSQDPKALPSKEVKPLKYSKLDRFANNIETNLAAAGNAQVKALEAFDQADADIGYWNLQNASDFIRNAHALSNLERLRLRDPRSANAVKNYVDGAELISPQMKSIIDSQNKLAPKYYQNSYYKRRGETHIITEIQIILVKWLHK
jgi:Asp-tRNA(Asn)/Glu-tRNA(Gln) amidotransferase A subunit family amidase